MNKVKPMPLFLAISLSLLSGVIYTVGGCSFFSTHPCGSMIGWPLPYAEYDLQWAFRNGIISRELDGYFGGMGGDIRIPLLHGYPLNIEHFSIIYFILNCLGWLLIFKFITYIARAINKLRDLNGSNNLTIKNIIKDKDIFISLLIIFVFLYIVVYSVLTYGLRL